MDLQKCRTCFIDLESNDLYLKLNTVNKNSKLSLAEKLRVCIPAMDLVNSDSLHICMQCSMHLETAYAFHVTCLGTEDQFQKYILRCNEEKTKKILSCSTCNINFSSKNIFDLHMKVMHTKDKIKDEKPIIKEEVKLDKIEKKEKPFLQMVFVQTTTIKDKMEGKRENRRKRGIKRQYSDEALKAKSERAKRAKRDNHGRFLTKEQIRQLAAAASKNKKEIPKLPDKIEEVKKTLPKIGNKIIEVRKSSPKPINKIAEVKKPLPKPINKIAEVKKPLPKPINKIAEVKKPLPKPINKIAEVKKPLPKPINHISDQNCKINLHKCKYCDKKFNMYGNLMRHISYSHSDKCKQCPICKKYYVNAKEHEQRYNCTILSKCEKSKKRTNKTKKYSFSTDGTFCCIETDNRFRCILCDLKYSRASDARAHLKNKHKTSQRCNTCKLTYGPMKYTVHIGQGCTSRIKVCNYTTDGECICPFCNKLFDERARLAGHFAAHVHIPLNCKFCNMKFGRLAGLAEHIVKGCDAQIIRRNPDDNNSTLFVDVLTTDSNVEDTARKDPLEQRNAKIPIKPNTEIPIEDRNELPVERRNGELPMEETNEELPMQETNELEEEEETNEIEQKGNFLVNIDEINTTYDSFTTESTTYTDSDMNMNGLDRDKAVKVEPTELLDNNTYLRTETDDDTNSLCQNLDGQLVPERNVNIHDTPDLIYVLENTF